MSTSKRHSRTVIGILGLYVLFTLVWSWPLPARMATHYAGDDVDVWINPWANWWTKKVLTEDLDLYHTDYLFYPQGTSLHFHSFSHFNTALWLVLEPLLGAVAAMNVTTLMAYVLSGFGVYLLVLYLTGSHWAGFIAGCVYTFTPWHIEQSSHPVINTTQWLPCVLLSFFKVLREKSTRWAVAGAVFLWLSALSSWHLFLFALMLLGLYIPYSIWAERKLWNPSLLRKLGMMALLTLLLVGPLLYPLARELLFGTSNIATGSLGRSTDLLGLITPSHHHPLWGRFMPPGYGWHTTKKCVYVGLGVLLVALYAMFRMRRRVAWWVFASLVFMILSLGPYLQVGGVRYEAIKFPWGISVAHFVRATDRFQILLTLTLAVLVGYGLTDLHLRTKNRVWPRIGLWLLGGLLLLDLAYYPFPNLRLNVPDSYDRITAEPDQFAILDIPMKRVPTRYYMYYQTFHEKPLVEGVISRPSADAFDYIAGDQFLYRLRQERVMDPALADVSRQLLDLADDGIRYLVIHKYLAPAHSLPQWADYLTVPPFYEDEDVLVYRTSPPHGASPPLPYDLGMSPTPVRAVVTPTVLAQTGVLTTEVHWYAPDAPERDLKVRLSLVNSDGDSLQGADFTVCDGWPTSEWPAGAVALGQYAFQTNPRLVDPGIYTLTLALVDPECGIIVGRPVSLDQIGLRALQRRFDLPSPTVPLTADFGEQVRLLGYDLSQTADTLTLTLHWQAVQQMDESYKVFVHLFDPATEAIVAQDDSAPRRWAYPTTWWQEGEVVSDPVPLSLVDVPAGIYRLAIGVYHPGTGEQLPLLLAGTPVLDRRFILSEEIVR